MARVKRCSRRLLFALYKAARWLSLLSSSLDMQRQPMQLIAPQRRRKKLCTLLWRVFVTNIFWAVQHSMFYTFKSVSSYADLMALLQSASVSVFAVFSFVGQARAESSCLAIVNRYIALHARICKLSNSSNLLPLKFSLLYALKLLLTLCGLLYELQGLWQNRMSLESWIGNIIGVYMWLGTLFVLDATFLGLLLSGVYYEHLGMHIELMLQRLQALDVASCPTHARLSHYRRMCLLCDFADELDTCGLLYSELYDLTRSFVCIFQWQILFYIYYNFIEILLMMYDYICQRLDTQTGDMFTIFLASIKFANILMLIMCADYTIKKSQLPHRLALDIVCSDMDLRWDKSAESFIGQLQAQILEVNILGIVQLNNGFIPVILSAIITYLFILIQFGFTGGFKAVHEVVAMAINNN
ncbi:Gr93a [Drosophila busckii]|uniref:Gustatory receptor n=1 Tax=Drosophila busckii TaxID=30019 RepID=A0A0M5J4R2_DROBS|nr:gustatory receptor for bitter taste 93a [Drosophila busckii]ALC46156.1 Gr93a [Drosophila busckii]